MGELRMSIDILNILYYYHIIVLYELTKALEDCPPLLESFFIIHHF